MHEVKKSQLAAVAHSLTCYRRVPALNNASEGEQMQTSPDVFAPTSRRSIPIVNAIRPPIL